MGNKLRFERYRLIVTNENHRCKTYGRSFRTGKNIAKAEDEL